MDSRPPSLLLLLLLASLLHCSHCDTVQSSFIIDAVDLTISPRSTVQSGMPVTVHCNVRVSHDNIPHLTHTFQLRRDDVVIYSVNTADDSVVYEINPARAADSGSYDCQVAVKDKRRTSSSQNLEVTGLQTPILYLSKTRFYEGDDFIATCSAPEEKGSLRFRFFQRYRNEEPQKMKQLAPTGNSSKTTLILREIGDYSLYCDYEISLVSGSKRSNHSNEIQVMVQALHITPIMNVLPSTTVYEGDIIEFVCKVVSPLKNVEVFLTKDSRILKKAPVSLNHQFTAQEGDSGELTCKAQWGNVQKETYQSIIVKEVFSKPNLTMDPPEIFEGDTFKLTCTVTVYVPEKMSIQFFIFKDNIQLTSSETYNGVAGPNTNGNYTCKAKVSPVLRNLEKESKTIAFKAKVLVSKPLLSVVGGTLVLGNPFQVLCHSDNGTLPITYTLQTPDRKNQEMVVRKPGQQAIFNSSAISNRQDLKKVICHAKNTQFKTVMKTSQLNSTNIIEPVSIPVLTTVPSMGDVSEGQDMTLICSVQTGSPPITFTWYHSETKGTLTAQTSEKRVGSYSIHNVKGKHKGGYYCVGTNPANKPQKSNTVPVKVRLASWKKGLIALFCILIALALVLVIAFKARLLPFKRKRRDELSVKSASTKAELQSLTQAGVNESANATPGMMGKSVWSERASGSESDDQNSVTAVELQFTEVQTKEADPNRVPVKKGTDTVYSEVRNSKHGVPEHVDGQGSVEYAQLNRDTDQHSDHGDHGDYAMCVQDDHGGHGDYDTCVQDDHGGHGDYGTCVQDDHVNETDNSAEITIGDHGEWKNDPQPD